MSRRAVPLGAVVCVLMMIAACVPARPDDQDWRTEAERAVGTVAGQVAAVELVLGADTLPAYDVVIASEAHELASSVRDGLAELTPPATLHRLARGTSGVLDGVVRLLARVRDALARGVSPTERRQLAEALAHAGERLDRLEDEVAP